MQNDSPAPRTDKMQRIQFEGCECVVASPEYMEGIEKELNEAKRDADNCRQIIETYSKQEDDLVQLAKESKVMWEALILARDTAKGNNADKMPTLFNVEEVLDEALRHPNTTNPIVLTRDELIAEIEKIACGCNREVDWKSDCCDAVTEIEIGGPVCCMKCGYQCKMVNKGEVKIKCHQCKWLAELKGQS